jgi:hypothetical protein
MAMRVSIVDDTPADAGPSSYGRFADAEVVG